MKHEIWLAVEPPKGEAQEAVQNWVDNYTKWSADSRAHGMEEVRAGPVQKGTKYVRGFWRFDDEGDSPVDILSALHDRLGSFQNGLWHRAVYQYADHDLPADERTGTTWQEKTEGGSIPDDIPDPAPDLEVTV